MRYNRTPARGKTPARGRRRLGLLSLALLAVLVAPAVLGACSSGQPQPTEPPVTIMRSETSTPTATATEAAGEPAAPVAPAATPTEDGDYPFPTPAGTPRPTMTPMAYPTP